LGGSTQRAKPLTRHACLDVGHELGAAIDLDAIDLEGASAMSLSAKPAERLAVARKATPATVHLATGHRR
jgi:hypothetical protein